MSIEQNSALRSAEDRLARALKRVQLLQSRVEDLLYRSQRLANSVRRSRPAEDASLSRDLLSLREELRAFGEELQAIPALLARLEGGPERRPRGLSRSAASLIERMDAGLRTLLEQSRLAHEHVRPQALKPEAWALVQDADLLAARAKGLKDAAARLGGPKAGGDAEGG
jgi:FtsZ-binding cell division protein ZapB